ncbi:MAG: ATP synthase subunit I [Zoogloeaceae bacterium]|nr:ATP synthase subunit I [Zoogloeaceae bacterium]
MQRSAFRSVLIWQVGAAAFATGLSALLYGSRGAVSAALAAMACILPTLWLAFFLGGAKARDRLVSPARFFAGEFLKVGATLLLLLFAVKMYPNLNWPAFLLGLIMTAQANFLAFWKKI